MVGTWRDGFPRIILTLSGVNGPLDIEFIVDTGFDGDIIVPERLLFQLRLSPVGKQLVELAGGFRQRSQAYQTSLDWDGEPRLIEVLTLDGTLDGNPLIGNALWEEQALYAQNTGAGEVAFEPL